MRWLQPIFASDNLKLMKFIYCLLFCFFTTDILYCQNCKILDNKSFFTSIQFGNKIPDDLFLCSKKQNLPSLYYTGFRLEYDSLNPNCKNKYADLFSFLTIRYSFSQISLNKKGQIFLLDLYSFFDDNDTNDSTTYQPPVKFTETCNKLISLYGNPTRIEEANSTDSLLVKDLGMPKMVAWECNNISLILKVRYGSRSKALNVLDIQIINRNFDLPEQVEVEQ